MPASIEEHSSEDVVSLIDHKRISSIAVPDAMTSLAISYALQARTIGHGAEFVLLQVMKSLALLDGVSYCKPIHAERAALYVLPHRMKRDDTTTSQPSQGENGNSKTDRNQLENRAEHASTKLMKMHNMKRTKMILWGMKQLLRIQTLMMGTLILL